MVEAGGTERRVLEEAEPVPARWRGLKRVVKVVGAVVVFLVVLRLVWGWEAQRRLRAKIEEYRAAGEPILIEDFARAPVADEENAAVVYAEAHKALVGSLGEQVTLAGRGSYALGVGDVTSWPELVEKHGGAVDRLLAANAGALGLLREGRRRGACEWDIAFRSPLVVSFNAWFPTLSAHRSAVKLMCDAALVMHVRGEDEEAVVLLRDAIVYSDRLYDPRGNLLWYMVAEACGGLGFATVERVGGDLAVARGAEDAETFGGAARRDDVSALIARLLDDATCREGWSGALLGERAERLDTVEAYCRGRLTIQISTTRTNVTLDSWAPIRWALAPLWRLDAIEVLEYWSGIRRAGLAQSWREAVPLIPDDPKQMSRFEGTVRLHSTFSRRSYGDMVLLRYRYLARRRMAAVALAVRLYEIDYGRKPGRLEELVPDYLAALPVDPFAVDGATFRYLPGAERPRLYSVGVDGEDDGGYLWMTPARYWTWQHGSVSMPMRTGGVDWEQTDIAFSLDGEKPPRRVRGGEESESEEAAEDGGDVEDDGRDGEEGGGRDDEGE